MKAEKAIKEFAEKVAAKVTWAGAIGIDKNWLVEPLTALISEHYYPKEFVVWKDHNIMRCYGGWMFNYAGQLPEPKFKSYDEIFNYWKENER